MSGMHWIVVAAAVLTVVAGVAMGLAGITVGWVPPWGRRRILRPKLWGYGSLVATVGMSGCLFLGRSHGPSSVFGAVILASWVVWIVGLYVQLLAQRPGRVTPAPTTTAS
ncbi:hypothetical protein [Streptomyces sp. HUAS ZL42]|uniref:hypothetical protein n=1 Tax=Streptomyces sp. HUAS ZL42 TaxID=3231715 RepID=UPI00345F0F3E